ncbi:MAG: hypothetical protein ACK56F_28410, partial [bacterium]
MSHDTIIFLLHLHLHLLLQLAIGQRFGGFHELEGRCYKHQHDATHPVDPEGALTSRLFPRIQ